MAKNALDLAEWTASKDYMEQCVQLLVAHSEPGGDFQGLAWLPLDLPRHRTTHNILEPCQTEMLQRAQI